MNKFCIRGGDRAYMPFEKIDCLIRRFLKSGHGAVGFNPVSEGQIFPKFLHLIRREFFPRFQLDELSD